MVNGPDALTEAPDSNVNDGPPDIPGGYATLGGLGTFLVVLTWIAVRVKDAWVARSEQSREDKKLDHKHTKEDRRDALAEAWKNVDLARGERAETERLLSECRTANATCQAKVEAQAVEIRWRDERIAELRENLKDCLEGDHAGDSPVR